MTVENLLDNSGGWSTKNNIKVYVYFYQDIHTPGYPIKCQGGKNND